jgi:ZIP family zinc transporter
VYHYLMLALLALATCGATLLGGAVALRFRDQLHLILGFSAGAVVGVALFDLLPEALEIGAQYHELSALALAIAAGFFGYLILDRLVLLHTHSDESHSESAAPRRGAFGALTLSAHSLLDGVAVGIAFQASPAIGMIVAAAVLTHDFSDGINTVNLILRSGGSWRVATRWLVVDALAPVAGIASTLFFTIPESSLGPILAVFVGTFLYLGAADLIPESHHRHPRIATTLMTLFGAFLIYGVVSLAS